MFRLQPCLLGLGASLICLLRLRLCGLLLGKGVSLRGFGFLAGAVRISSCLFRGLTIPLRLLALKRFLPRLGFGFRFLLLGLFGPLAHGGALRVLLFLLTAFKRQYPSIFRRLGCSTGNRGYSLPTLLAAQIILSPGQEVFGFAHGVSCVAICAFRLGDGDGVSRLQ